MSDVVSKATIAWLPATIGSALWIGASSILLEDAYRTGHITVQHALMPVLTASTVAAAVYAERRLKQWKVVGFIGFAILALIGSALTVYSTLGRVSEAHDFKIAVARNTNNQTAERQAELMTAKEARDKECKSIGPKCKEWNARVDQLQKQMLGMVTTTEDSQLESAVNFVSLLVTVDETWLRKLLNSLATVGFPIFLEMGSIGFWAAAFPHRKPSHLPAASTARVTESMETLASIESVNAFPFTREQALADLRKLKTVGSQKFLADRWGVSEGQVSKLMAQWERDGQVGRTRTGKTKAATLALPPPEPARRRLGHMARMQ